MAANIRENQISSSGFRMCATMAFSLALLAFNAMAVDNYETSREHWVNNTTGFATSSYHEFVARDGYAISHLSSRETSRLVGNESHDKPMYMGIGSSQLCTQNTPCDGRQSTSYRIHEANAASNQTATLGAMMYATGVKVCLNNASQSRNKKLKGIKMYGGSISANGTVSSDRSNTWQRTNCRTWTPKISCQNGKYIKGVRAYYGQSGFTGFAIMCARATRPSAASTANTNSLQLKK